MIYDCDGCFGNVTANHKRKHWKICDECTKSYDQRKKEAESNLLLKAYTPDAHLWRISGKVMGDVSVDDIGLSMPFTIAKPILVEHTCVWCAIHNALMAVDPWAFELIMHEHGEYQEHNQNDIIDDLSWIDGADDYNESGCVTIGEIELPRGFFVDDLGIVGEDRWARKFGYPSLFDRRKSA
jgi:hypothetical protein